jgi:hypothetical protein
LPHLSPEPEDALLHLAHSRRPRRVGEWTAAKAVTFIVTLAASRSVTLAAARSGMSRKAAYALKRRDPAFGAAWNAALAATADPLPRRAGNAFQGDKVDEKVDEVDSPRSEARQGYNGFRALGGPFDALMRDFFFATIANRGSESSSLSRSNGERVSMACPQQASATRDHGAQRRGGGAITGRRRAPPPRNLRSAVPLPTSCAGREDSVAHADTLP